MRKVVLAFVTRPEAIKRWLFQDIAAVYPIKSLDDIYVLHYVDTDKIWSNNLAEDFVDIARDVRCRKIQHEGKAEILLSVGSHRSVYK